MAKLRLIRSTWLAEGVVALDFADPAGGDLAAWAPGAHLTLHLPGGVTRDYSLCGDPADRARYTVAVQRDAASRGGSTAVHDRLRVGEVIDVNGPRNNFALEDAPSYLLIAGGIGITPILAMARELAARDADWRLLYCGRSRTRMAFAGELLTRPEVTVHADDERGKVADLGAFLAAAPEGALVYACGPEPLLDGVQASIADPSRLRIERFRASFAAADSAREAEAAFDVVCSAGRVRVPPGTSVLQALLDAGVDVSSSCREGICGTCETRVVSGQPDHRDYLLSQDEKAAGESMMVCVSRSRTPELVLDL